jgi:hypothetical protein
MYVLYIYHVRTLVFHGFFLHQQTVCCLSMCCPIWTPAKGNQMWDQITNRTSVWFETEHTKICLAESQSYCSTWSLVHFKHGRSHRLVGRLVQILCILVANYTSVLKTDTSAQKEPQLQTVLFGKYNFDSSPSIFLDWEFGALPFESTQSGSGCQWYIGRLVANWSCIKWHVDESNQQWGVFLGIAQ